MNTKFTNPGDGDDLIRGAKIGANVARRMTDEAAALATPVPSIPERPDPETWVNEVAASIEKFASLRRLQWSDDDIHDLAMCLVGSSPDLTGLDPD